MSAKKPNNVVQLQLKSVPSDPEALAAQQSEVQRLLEENDHRVALRLLSRAPQSTLHGFYCEWALDMNKLQLYGNNSKFAALSARRAFIEQLGFEADKIRVLESGGELKVLVEKQVYQTWKQAHPGAIKSRLDEASEVLGTFVRRP